MGLQWSDSIWVIYKVWKTQVTLSLVCKGSTADPKILSPKLHAHADLRSLALACILSIGMCCGMPGVQSHQYDKCKIREPNILYSAGCRARCCISMHISAIMSCCCPACQCSMLSKTGPEINMGCLALDDKNNMFLKNNMDTELAVIHALSSCYCYYYHHAGGDDSQLWSPGALTMRSLSVRGDNLRRCSGFVKVSEMQSRTLVYVRYPSTGPRVQRVEVWGTSHNCTECAWLSRAMGYAGTASDLLSVSVLLMCMHTSAHNIWSNSGL